MLGQNASEVQSARSWPQSHEHSLRKIQPRPRFDPSVMPCSPSTLKGQIQIGKDPDTIGIAYIYIYTYAYMQIKYVSYLRTMVGPPV